MAEEELIDTLRTRLEAAIKFRGTNAKALSRQAGLGETGVRDIIKGQNTDVRLGTVQKIAAALGMTLADLLPGASRTDLAPDIPQVRSASGGDGAIAVRQVDLAYAMGSGVEIDEFPDEIPVLFDAGFLRSLTQAPADRLFVARGEGDSMFPTMINGDLVMIDTTQRRLNLQDRIWALSVHGAGMIKRLRAIGPDRVRILSDNPAIPPEEVSAEDLFIAGRVIYIGRKV